MAILNMVEEDRKIKERLNSKEEMLGKGLTQPFNYANSGARKLMYSLHREQSIPLLYCEPPLVGTGMENSFGVFSSSYFEAKSNFEVLGKVDKFSNIPLYKYSMIVYDMDKDMLDVIDRVSYKHITEVFGYTYNNDYIDRLSEGDIIPEGAVYKKSTSFDDQNNRMDGVNLLVGYLSCDETKEDGIEISESAADKFKSPLFKVAPIVINDNDILLNLYGEGDVYKAFPDIGEEIKDGFLCSIRREKKEESLFTQSVNRLKTPLVSDDSVVIKNGKVIDINVYCNNPDNLASSFYNSQVYKYYQENIRFCKELVAMVDSAKEEKDTLNMSYELEKLYYNAKAVLEGKQYIKDRTFSNVLMEIVVMDVIPLEEGDKLSNRYGGKGVVSKIIRDEQMPMLDNGKHLDIIINKSTYISRMNSGQMLETAITFTGNRLIDLITSDQMGIFAANEIFELICEFIEILNPEEANYLRDTMSALDDQAIIEYIESIILNDGIMISLRPMTDIITIDTIAKIHEQFGWLRPYTISSPIIDSNGNLRYVKAIRPLYCGKMYMYRLKQYAEEKFSAVSLSSTNLRNENSRNKSNKVYKSLHTNTPIRFGEMETNNLGHMGTEYVVINLMLHSTSPNARRRMESLLTGSPYEIDVKLDDKSVSRSAENLNVYLKTIGLKLEFIKKPKILERAILFESFRKFNKAKPIKVVEILHPDEVNKVKETTPDKDGLQRAVLLEAVKVFK